MADSNTEEKKKCEETLEHLVPRSRKVLKKIMGHVEEHRRQPAVKGFPLAKSGKI